MEYSIQRSAKNLAIDQYSSKNKRNKELIDIVIEPGDYKKEVMEKYSGYKHKEDDSNVLPLPEKLPPQEDIRKNEDDIIKNTELKIQKQKVDDYMNNKMNPKMALALKYHMQGLSGQEIASLMEENHGNIRKLIYKARLELARAFQPKDEKR